MAGDPPELDSFSKEGSKLDEPIDVPAGTTFRKPRGLITSDYSLEELQATDAHGIARGAWQLVGMCLPPCDVHQGGWGIRV